MKKLFTGIMFMAVALFMTQLAYAQAECAGGACGTPYESGGGGCGCGGGSVLIANTDMGDTYQYGDDFDVDGWEDDFDNCPFAVNPDQDDSDGDGFGDSCDNCPALSNPDQLDADGDFMGNGCDQDADNDGVLNGVDTCPYISNSLQNDDLDGDGLGNVCDNDDDGDDELDVSDPCPLLPNVTDRDDDRCDNDSDNDGIRDSVDLCPFHASDDNGDNDGDMIGDACDIDLDNDGIPNISDNCMLSHNPNQINADRDGFGDACDSSFCFVVDSAEAGSCLNPQDRFLGRPGPAMEIQPGEQLRLRIFTNRPNAPTQFAWKVVKAPGGADYQVENQVGTVNYSSPWEFHYSKGDAATLVAHTPGDYEVELQTNLVFEDELYPTLRSDKQIMKVTVSGEGGCSALGASSASLTMLLLAGLALVGRKRRK